MSNRIVSWADYGEHIPLVCTNCGQTGNTKNIDFIGARTIFMHGTCDCSLHALAIQEPADVDKRRYEVGCKRRIQSAVFDFNMSHMTGLRQARDQAREENPNFLFERIREIRAESLRFYRKVYREMNS
jgi:lysylphosphatidylglycerol synthetase-like protein (DUF2156 family)